LIRFIAVRKMALKSLKLLRKIWPLATIKNRPKISLYLFKIKSFINNYHVLNLKQLINSRVYRRGNKRLHQDY
jgi:hypothetical protein